MAKKIKAIKCPQCGSTKQNQIDEEHFKCQNCETEYIIDSEDININHTYVYDTNTAQPQNTKIKGKVILALICIPFLIIILLNVFSSSNGTVSELVASNKYTFSNATVSQVFEDANGNFKLFIVGTIISENTRKYNQETKGELYWAIYDVATDKMEKLNVFDHIKTVSNSIALNSQVSKFDDGNIYFIFNYSEAFLYDVKLNSLVNINDQLLNKIPKIKNGIAKIELNKDYDFLLITSNSGKIVQYFPSTNAQYENSWKDNYYPTKLPNPSLITKYASSISNPNFIIKYQAMQQIGYPAKKNPKFKVNFNINEEPSEVLIDEDDKKRVFLENYKILNTENSLYKLDILDYNTNNVLISYKKSIQVGEDLHVQLLDDKGVMKWSTITDMGFVVEGKSMLSKNNQAFVGKSHDYLWIDSAGKIKKKLKLDELTFKLD